MWLASLMKSSAVVSAVFVVAGVAWAVESGVGGGQAGANSAPGVAVVALENGTQVSGAAGNSGTVDAKFNDFHFVNENQDAAKEAYENLIKTRLDESQALLHRAITEKAEKGAELEMRQLEKSFMQRNLERLTQKLSELETQSLAVSADSKDDRQRVSELIEKITAQISELQSDLMKTTQSTAKMTADLEIVQLELQRKQRRLEELDRLSDKMQYELTNQAQYEAKFAPTTINVDRVNTATTQVDKESSGKLDPGDTIRVHVANAFADQPLNSVYTIEPVGTIALGPAYGRVIVKGMTVLEAEEAIKKHLAKVIEDPAVQVTLSGKQSSVRELQDLYSDIDKLRTENANLKKQLDNLRRK